MMPIVILMIAPTAVAEPVAQALRAELDAEVEIAPQRRSGLAALRRSEFSVVLLEESYAEVDPRGVDVLYQNAGSAPVVELNFVISRPPRIVRQVRSALVHRAQDNARARADVARTMQHELGASLSGILLESQLALQHASPELAPKLEHLVELARNLRNHLRVGAANPV